MNQCSECQSIKLCTHYIVLLQSIGGEVGIKIGGLNDRVGDCEFFKGMAQTNAQQTHGEICSNAAVQSEYLCKLDGRECAGNDIACEDRKLSPC